VGLPSPSEPIKARANKKRPHWAALVLCHGWACDFALPAPFGWPPWGLATGEATKDPGGVDEEPAVGASDTADGEATTAGPVGFVD
jgi:hypothetical protein